MRGGRGQAFTDELVPVVGPQGLQEAGEVTGAEVGVHIGDLTLQVRFVALA